MVRFEGLISVDKFRLYFLISIPVWCDLKFTVISVYFHNCRISIPVWCDLKVSRLKYQGYIIPYFNSSMVRFEGLDSNIDKTATEVISIPVWCDLKYANNKINTDALPEFQFQYGAI